VPIYEVEVKGTVTLNVVGRVKLSAASEEEACDRAATEAGDWESEDYEDLNDALEDPDVDVLCEEGISVVRVVEAQ
jgi:hypothetical protein